jgi:hypothetical protein
LFCAARREQRTPHDEQLLRQIHEFRRELRAHAVTATAGPSGTLAPYAMIFGIAIPSEVSIGTHDSATAQHRETEVPWSRFARSWMQDCERLFSEHGHAHQPGNTRSHDLVRQWSAPRDHGYDSQAGSPGHGGYGHSGGGHGGGFDGGGHGGH